MGGLDFLETPLVEPPYSSLEALLRQVRAVQGTVQICFRSEPTRGRPPIEFAAAPGTEVGFLGRDLLKLAQDFMSAWKAVAAEERGDERR